MKNNGEIEGENGFDELFNWYMKLTNLIRCLDNCFKEFAAIFLLSFIIGLFLLIWSILTWDSTCITGINSYLVPYWMIFTIILLSTIIFISVQLNIQVKFKSYI